jgi:multiple sugar transport system ATP-binding protein
VAVVSFKNVFKRYGASATAAVSDLTLEIEDGEFMVLVGPSGCGKTTALRMLAGLEEVTDGEIEIAGKLVTDVPASERDIAMVFQNYALYPHMTVFQNMAFPLVMRKRPKSEVATKVTEAAETLGLEALLERKPGELSGGQRQRVALGRAIVRQPDVFLLDEPLSNLDAQLRLETRVHLKKLHRVLGTTFIYVTHDQVEAMTMGDRIVVMRGGVLQQVATPRDIYGRPANMYVAGFIGMPRMNFIPAAISGTVARTSGFTVDLPFALPSSDYMLGIRPDHIANAPTTRHADDVRVEIEMDVDVIEVLGADQYLYGRVGSDDIVARTDAQTEVHARDRVRLALDVRRVCVFDPQTEQLVAGPRDDALTIPKKELTMHLKH